MARLFSALLPSAAAVNELAGLVGGEIPRLRWTPTERWHVTVGFFGDGDDPIRRAKWLRRRVAGLAAPRLRLSGAGTFRGVLFVGVTAESDADSAALARLARAGGAGRRGYRPHLTVARWRGHVERQPLLGRFAGFAGSPFTPEALLLMRSDQDERGPRYSVVERVPLATGPHRSGILGR